VRIDSLLRLFQLLSPADRLLHDRSIAPLVAALITVISQAALYNTGFAAVLTAGNLSHIRRCRDSNLRFGLGVHHFSPGQPNGVATDA